MRGTVVDEAGAPLAAVDVRVAGSADRAVTDAAGTFAVRVGGDEAELIVERIGFHAARVRVTLPAEPLRVTLHTAPVEVEGIAVDAPRAPPLAQTITAASVRALPALGEPDVFRALVALPLVSQPNDLKGRIHLAGGASDETGILLDGHPLQDPTHLLGLFGAVNPWALERADVEIGYVPPAHAGALSGSVALVSRRAATDPGHTVIGGLLATSWTSAFEARGSIDALASARITYLDRVADFSGLDVPLMGFHDVTARFGRAWADRGALDVVFYHGRDRLIDSELRDNDGYEPVRWGESMVGATGALRLSRVQLTTRASVDAFRSSFRESDDDDADTVAIRRDLLSLAADARTFAGPLEVVIGVARITRAHEQGWRASGLVDDIFSPATPAEFSGSEEQTEAAVWLETSYHVGTVALARIGARGVNAGAAWYGEPQVSIEWGVRPLTATIAAARRHQFTAQLTEPIEGSITVPVFLLERPRVADVFTVRLERRGDTGASLRRIDLTGFFKDHRNRPVLADSAAEFPTFEYRPGTSWGVALAGVARTPFGATAQGSYTFQRSTEETSAGSVPSGWDAPHALGLLLTFPFRERWSASVSYTAHSGRATTPVLMRLLEPTPGPRFGPRYVLGEENSIRVPAYHRLDVGARRSWTRGRYDITLAVDVMTLLNRRNLIDYEWRDYYASLVFGDGSDEGRRGLPIVPTVSIQVLF